MAQSLLHTKAEVVRDHFIQSEVDEGVIDAVVGSTNVLDRMGDVITQDGWVLDNYSKNPVILWGHNIKEERPPIGKALKIWLEGKQQRTKKLMFQVKFDLQDSFAAEVYRKVKDGFINTVSVGFLPTEWEDVDMSKGPLGGRKYTKQELLELSFVPVPANPEATVALRSMSQEDKRFEPVEEKDLYSQVEVEEKVKKEERPKEEVVEETTVLMDLAQEKIGAEIEDKAGNNMKGKLATMGTHIDDMDKLRGKMMKDEGMEEKAVAMDDVKMMKEHSGDVMGLCDEMMDMMGMMGKELQTEEDKAVGGMKGKLTSMGNHIGLMKSLQEKMTEDNSKEAKEVMEGDVKAMKNHASAVSGVCDDIIEMMGKKEVVAEVVEEVVPDEIESKRVIPFKDLGTAPESESWDGPGEIAKAEVSDLKVICAWVDSDNAENKGAYKLPHHHADGHKAVWRGVAAAMAALLGARGGVQIPDTDKKSVYNHLKKHYAQFDKEAPDYKMVEDQVLAKLENETYALALDREDKHEVRLIKKVLKKQVSDGQKVVKALEAISVALDLFKSNLAEKGGD